jgi:hypothetical protein
MKLLIAGVFFIIISSFSVQQTLWIGHCEIYSADYTALYSVVKVINNDDRSGAQRLFNNYLIKTYPKGHLNFNSYTIIQFFDRAYISNENPLGETKD